MDDDHEYVDLELTVENGVVTDCRYFGEGRQVDFIAKPYLLEVVGSTGNETSWQRRFEKRLQRAFRKLA